LYFRSTHTAHRLNISKIDDMVKCILGI
jgi:hypothetical protein